MGMLIWMTLRVRASFQIEVSEVLDDASARYDLCMPSIASRTHAVTRSLRFVLIKMGRPSGRNSSGRSTRRTHLSTTNGSSKFVISGDMRFRGA